MKFFAYFNEWISAPWIGVAYLFLLLGTGVFLSFYLGGIQIFGFFRAFRETFGRLFKKPEGEGTISPFQAAATALAGTLGTGNIVGVATALMGGGPGAVFWMCVSAFFGMATKYAEIFLAVKFREKNEKGEFVGGPMYYIEKGLKNKPLALLFAGACVAASFGVGNLAQSGAVSDALYSTFQLPKLAVGAVLAFLVGMVILGGIKRIAAFTERCVPIMAITYLVGALVALALNAGKIPAALQLIFYDAFHPQAVTGGILGYLTCRAVRFGVSRGVFSNEAGLGSAPIAHGAAQTDSAPRQAMWGIVEVFLDTIVMCTLTTVVILTSGAYGSGAEGAALTTAAFAASLGRYASSFVAISTVFFAVSSILGWCYFGEKAVGYLSGQKRYQLLYRLFFVGAVFAGAVGSMDAIWSLSDFLNILMAIPNLLAVLSLRKIILVDTRNFLLKSDKKTSRK